MDEPKQPNHIFGGLTFTYRNSQSYVESGLGGDWTDEEESSSPPQEPSKFYLVTKKPDRDRARANLLMSDGLDIKFLDVKKGEVVRWIEDHPFHSTLMLCGDICGAKGYVDAFCLEPIIGSIFDFLKNKGLPSDGTEFIVFALERKFKEKTKIAETLKQIYKDQQLPDSVVYGTENIYRARPDTKIIDQPAWQKMASTPIPYAGIPNPGPTQPTGFQMSTLRPAPPASNPNPPKVLICRNGTIQIKRHFANSVVLKDRTETVVLRTGACNQHIVARTKGVWIKEDHEQGFVDVYEIIPVKEAYIEHIYGFEYLIVFIDGLWKQKCSILLSPDVTYEVKSTNDTFHVEETPSWKAGSPKSKEQEEYEAHLNDMIEPKE